MNFPDPFIVREAYPQPDHHWLNPITYWVHREERESVEVRLLPFPQFPNHFPIQVNLDTPLSRLEPLLHQYTPFYIEDISSRYTTFAVPVHTPAGIERILIEKYRLHNIFHFQRPVLYTYLQIHNLYLHNIYKTYTPTAAAA